MEDPFNKNTTAFLAWFVAPDRQRTGTCLGPSSRENRAAAGGEPEPNQISIVDWRDKGRGRAVVALQDIEADTILFTVSHRDILCISSSDISKLLTSSQKSSLPPWAACVLTLIFEHGRGSDGKWWPYISILPEHFDTLMHWDDDDLKELQGSHVVRKIGRQDAEALIESQLWPVVRAHAAHFGSHATTFSDPNEKNALNALLALAHRFASLVMAYAFDLDQDETKDDPERSMEEDGFIEETPPPKGMVPFADMLNAEGEQLNNARLFHGECSVSMVSVEPIKAGSEILNDYGSLPNAEMLRCYGYVASAYDAHDVVELDLEPIVEIVKESYSLNDKQVTKRLDVADRWDALDESYDLSRINGSTDSIDDALILTTMALVAGDEELKELKLLKKPPAPKLGPKSAQIISQAIRKRQKDYATTIAEDSAALTVSHGQSTKSLRKQMAIKVRLGEKEILASNLEALRQAFKESSNESLSEHAPNKRQKT